MTSEPRPVPTGLELCEVVICYGPRATIGPVTAEVAAGGVLGLVGSNGSGKTSIMRAICALQPVQSGTVRVRGQVVTPGVPVERLGAMIEEPRFYPWLSAVDNLLLAAGGRLDWDARVPRVIERVGLGAAADVKVREFSQGMRQRLGLARALLGDPRLLVLDEPTNGLDTAGIALMRELLAHVAEVGTTLVLSSHMLGEVDHLATHVVALRAGEVVAAGTKEEIVAGWGSVSAMYAGTVEGR